MITNKNKKVLKIIIIAALIFILLSFTATKIIYDSVFTRYECNIDIDSDEIKQLVASRKDYRYPSGNNMLSGYLYKSVARDKNDTLIILAPGHYACSDNYLWQIYELLECGWSVFAFNPTGSCTSDGDSAIGFPQEILDLKATIEFIENQNRLDYNKIVLMGHSRGGYAACCALSYGYDISAVVSISGINSAMDGIIGSSSRYIGNLAYTNYGFLWLYQVSLFGSKTVNLSADKVLSESNVPALIIHGENDESIPIDKHSIFSHKDKIKNDKTEYLLCTAPENSGHTDLLFSKDGSADDNLMDEINKFLIKNTR